MNENLFDLQKALTTANDALQGSVLDPVLLSKVISDLVRRQPVLRNIIKRVPWNTNSYTFDSVDDYGVAQLAADGGTLTYSDATFSKQSYWMNYAYYIALISNPAILAAQELVPLVSMRVSQAVKSVMRTEETTIFNGNAINGNVGLFGALKASPTYAVAGDGAQLSKTLLASMISSLTGEGYLPGVFVVSPGAYNIISQGAYNAVRFLGLADNAIIGYSLNPGTQTPVFNGVPVVQAKYAEQANPVVNKALVQVSGNTYAFTSDGTTALSGGIYKSAGSDFATTTWAAPVVKIGGATTSAYTTNANGTITFTASPSATPTGSFSYGTENVLLLSLDPADLVIAEQLPIMVEQDLAKPVAQDVIPFRVKQYSVCVPRNIHAHVLASNVQLPNAATFLAN